MHGVAPVLSALASGRWDDAATIAVAAAAADPDSRLAAALSDFLQQQQAPGVYDEPTAFQAFIDHGSNPELYRRTIATLRAVHAAARPTAVVDIGCGDGRVVAGVLDASTERVDLVEPSEALLGRAAAALVRPGLDVVAHPMGASDLVEHVGPDQRWGVAQSTFALHTTRPAERPALLAWLARRVDRLLIVEFDVPAFEDRSSEHLGYLAERYEAGVREYVDQPEAIGGFLMPVLVGQLDPTRPRFTFEQPIAAWAAALSTAGFAVETTPVFEYWWGPAVLLDARPIRPWSGETVATETDERSG